MKVFLFNDAINTSDSHLGKKHVNCKIPKLIITNWSK